MQRSPLVDATTRVKVKSLKLLLLDYRFIHLYDRLYALVLAFPDSSVQGSPIVIVLLIDFRAALHQILGDHSADVCILGEEVHDEMQGRFTVIVGFVNVGTPFDQSLDQTKVKSHNS